MIEIETEREFSETEISTIIKDQANNIRDNATEYFENCHAAKVKVI